MIKLRKAPFGPKDENEAQIYAEEEFRVDVQQAINELMLAKHVSQKGLAERLGVSEARVGQVFSDRCNVSLRILARIFFVLGGKCELLVRDNK